ncbi:hypothetical protein ACROYT_G001817 [Oculina patagonica]
MQHKEAVVKTLLHRANLLPSRPELRTNEQDRVLHDLRANEYPDVLFKKCVRDRTKERPTQERPLGLALLPYVRGASDRVGRVLKKFRVRTAFKPVRSLGHVFRKPKDRPAINRMAGIVYKVKCHDCSFMYIGESKRSWSSRGAEHDPGRASNNESAIKQHAESTEHNIHPKDAQILERGVVNYSKRLFLESWHSTLDSDAINERKAFPRAYVPVQFKGSSYEALKIGKPDEFDYGLVNDSWTGKIELAVDDNTPQGFGYAVPITRTCLDKIKIPGTRRLDADKVRGHLRDLVEAAMLKLS